MRRAFAAAFVLLAVSGASSASAGSLEVRLGAAFPGVNSQLFDDDADLYGTEKSDWTGVTGGIEYRSRVADNLEVGIHLDGYGTTVDTSYLDYVRPSGREIMQTLKYSTAPLGLTLRLVGGDRHAAIQPYIGFGADVVFWHYEEDGEFIDFDDPDLAIFEDTFISDGAAPAAHVAAGIRVGLSPDIGLSGEVRYLAAPTVDMGDDFGSNRINVSGASATVGFFVNF